MMLQPIVFQATHLDKPTTTNDLGKLIPDTQFFFNIEPQTLH